MGFITDFKNIIEGDPSLNSLITGGIKFVHLPEDFDITKTWVAWDWRVLEQVNTLGCNNVYTVYSIPVTITATDSIVMNNMADRLRTYLNSVTTDNFINIYFVSENKITTLSRSSNAYQNTLEFNAIYV